MEKRGLQQGRGRHLLSYELLRVKVVLQKEEKKGCKSALGGDGLLLSAIFVSSALIKGKKKIEEEKHEN